MVILTQISQVGSFAGVVVCDDPEFDGFRPNELSLLLLRHLGEPKFVSPGEFRWFHVSVFLRQVTDTADRLIRLHCKELVEVVSG